MFVERSTVAAVAGTAAYALPARHIATIAAALDGSALRPATCAELSAENDTWESASGTPVRYVPDMEGREKFGLYPAPDAAGTVSLIHTQSPSAVDTQSPTVNAPAVMADYLAWAMLSQARGKESDAHMADVAAHAAERARMFEQVFAEYWA